MPLEIRELVIRTSVGDSAASANASTPAASTPADSLSDKAQATIIAACVEQVLAVLQAKQER